MSLGGLIGGLLSTVTGGLGGGVKKERPSTPAARPVISQKAPQKKMAKAGRLALIKTTRTGVLDDTSTAGRGKLFGN